MNEFQWNIHVNIRILAPCIYRNKCPKPIIIGSNWPKLFLGTKQIAKRCLFLLILWRIIQIIRIVPATMKIAPLKHSIVGLYFLNFIWPQYLQAIPLQIRNATNILRLAITYSSLYSYWNCNSTISLSNIVTSSKHSKVNKNCSLEMNCERLRIGSWETIEQTARKWLF